MGIQIVTRPEFATNRPSAEPPQSVASAVSNWLANYSIVPNAPLLISTAYFNVGGFKLLADQLESFDDVKLLIGSEPTDPSAHLGLTPLRVLGADRGDPRIRDAVAASDNALAVERNLTGFGHQPDKDAERLIDWLRSGKVEVRRLETDFLHGKGFIVDVPGHEAAIAGSSNFTYAGLARNRELNLGVYSPTPVRAVTEWFTEQWKEAVDYDLAALYEARRVPHQPWHVYLRMLYELYGATFESDRSTVNELGLKAFQIDGVWRAKRILEKRNGVVVADEVGLGKTYIAGELMREAAIERRQKVLVVAPATLRDSTWKKFGKDFPIPFDLVSYEQLVACLSSGNYNNSDMQPPDAYAMVIIDEAHNLRNGSTTRAEYVRELLGGRAAKQLVLLTATPVNNSLEDLKTLISYITPSDSEFADIDVPSLDEYFKRAMAIDPEHLTGLQLFDVMDAITVRRTRPFIKKYYPEENIKFPTPRVHRVDYELEPTMPSFFATLATALGAAVASPTANSAGATHNVLSMARYTPSQFQRNGNSTAQYQVQNAGLIRSGLLKRFESSTTAFRKTLEQMIRSHQQFLGALSQGHVLAGEALRAWAASDTDDVEDLIDELDPLALRNVSAVSDYDAGGLQAAVEADLALLQKLRDSVNGRNLLPTEKSDALAKQSGFDSSAAAPEFVRDPKVAALVDELALIAGRARQEGIGDSQIRDKRKVIIFTYFADTAEYLHDAITQLTSKTKVLSDYKDRVALATGRDRGERQSAIVGFAPKTAGATGEEPDLFDLVIATDVLSEGVNLQQAGNIINYDLPWNPMRLVQRHGRVDRIGSEHDEIHLNCFFPADELEQMLNLEAVLQRKLHQASAAVGTSNVLPGVAEVDRTFAENAAQIRSVYEGKADLFEPNEFSATSGEELQRQLAKAFESSATRKAVLDLPWGAGTAFLRRGEASGITYCAQVADHDRPYFRFVPISANLEANLDDLGNIECRSNMLEALLAVNPGEPDVEADLPTDLIDTVFEVWEAARRSIFDQWQARTDPLALQPVLPKAMRDAADHIRDHGAHLGNQQDVLIRRLGQVVDRRIQREIREILNSGETNQEIATKLLQAADDLRIQQPIPVEPMPEIRLEDVRLIAWSVVRPSPNAST